MSSTAIPSASGRYQSLGQSLSPSWPQGSVHSAVGAVYANSAVTTGLSVTGSHTLGTGGYTFANNPDTSNSTLKASTLKASTLKAGTLTLQGQEADIEINGVSLMTVLQGIQERLNILEPNRTLEAEWQELQALGEQYRKLEVELLEKQRTWSQLTH